MTQPAQQKDLKELVGFPRAPILKPKRADRIQRKNALENETGIDPVMGIRVSIALGLPVRSEWLSAGSLDLALSPADVAKHLDKLVSVKKLLDAVSVTEFLNRRLDRTTAGPTLSALRKLLIPKRGGKKQ
jgi:hypothetical protein